MSRLIEAGKILDNLSGMLKSMDDYDAVKKVINDMPTAYDVDAVVKQLEELTEEECTLHECGIRSERCKPCIAKKAIEIVKGSGVDAKTHS